MKEKILEMVRSARKIEQVAVLNRLGSLEHRTLIDELVEAGELQRVTEPRRGTWLYPKDAPVRVHIARRRAPKRTPMEIAAANANVSARMTFLENRVTTLEAKLAALELKSLGL